MELSDIISLSVYDTTIDLFESQYPVPKGVMYNSWLIDGDNPTIMDTVDDSYGQQWFDMLADALGDRSPRYIVSLHSEPDHSAMIAEALDRWPSLTLVATKKAETILGQLLGAHKLDGRVMVVGDGDALDLDGHLLRFFTAPMVHWPEVMVAYDEVTGILFSADAFGTFGPGAVKSLTYERWNGEAARYYYNICGKYGPQVQALLKKVSSLVVKRIYPLHGPIIEHSLEDYINAYDRWSRYRPDVDGVMIAVASIYGNTMEAARRVVAMLADRDVPSIVFDLARCDQSAALAEAFRRHKLLLAASSYDGSVFPPMTEFLHHLQLKGYRDRSVGMIQNGTWAPTAARAMSAIVETMRDVSVLEPVVTIKSRLTDDDMPQLEALVDALAR